MNQHLVSLFGLVERLCSSCDSWLPLFQHDFETVGPLQDDVTLELVIVLLEVGFDSVVAHDGGEEDLQFKHGVFTSCN